MVGRQHVWEDVSHVRPPPLQHGTEELHVCVLPAQTPPELVPPPEELLPELLPPPEDPPLELLPPVVHEQLLERQVSRLLSSVMPCGWVAAQFPTQVTLPVGHWLTQLNSATHSALPAHAVS